MRKTGVDRIPLIQFTDIKKLAVTGRNTYSAGPLQYTVGIMLMESDGNDVKGTDPLFGPSRSQESDEEEDSDAVLPSTTSIGTLVRQLDETLPPQDWNDESSGGYYDQRPKDPLSDMSNTLTRYATMFHARVLRPRRRCVQYTVLRFLGFSTIQPRSDALANLESITHNVAFPCGDKVKSVCPLCLNPTFSRLF
eukprot:3497523-Pyramimonas_sp.AAC.1